MKVLAVSDVHFEFHADDGASLLAELDADVDVVVIAGDLSVAPKLFEALRFFREKFERVVYVPGNHDWFHTTRSGMARIRERVERDLPGAGTCRPERLRRLHPAVVQCLGWSRSRPAPYKSFGGEPLASWL